MSHSVSSPFDLLFCRPGGEAEARAELDLRYGRTSRVAAQGLLHVPQGHLPERPCLFERQRLPGCRYISFPARADLPSELVTHFWETWMQEPQPWAYFPSCEQDSPGLTRRSKGLLAHVLREGNQLHPGIRKWERKPEKLIAKQQGSLLATHLTEDGLYFGTITPDQLTAPAPGGVMRMQRDPGAPSRSYMKIEEAFVRMQRHPEEGETVIDLGAAPGGWSYAFARRGCQVTSVDNGPLRIQDACVRHIEHVHQDGLRFPPPAKHLPPVDWLVADMLIPPGKAFGVLKRWLSPARCRHIVLNIKCPQEEPVPALIPILDWLDAHHPQLQVRQLVHDRKEVTVFGPVIS